MPFTRDIENFWVEHAQREVLKTYGDKVSVREKSKSLFKFGRSLNVSTSLTTIGTFGAGEANETYVNDNLITTVSSSDVGDTQDLVLEGHTIDVNGDFTFVTQVVTLDGQNQVTLSTPLARATRAYNNNSTDLAGNIYFYEDDTSTAGVPTTATGVHLVINSVQNQSFKAATTFSKEDYYFLESIYADIARKTAATVDVYFEMRLKGKVFRQTIPLSITSDGNIAAQKFFRPYIIIPKNSDVRMRAASLSGTGIEVTGTFNGILAKVM